MNIFPYILAALDIGAAVVYTLQGDYWRAGYWLSAAFLTYSTTRI